MSQNSPTGYWERFTVWMVCGAMGMLFYILLVHIPLGQLVVREWLQNRGVSWYAENMAMLYYSILPFVFALSIAVGFFLYGVIKKK